MELLRGFAGLAHDIPLSGENILLLRAWPVLPGVIFGLIPIIWALLLSGWSAVGTGSLPWWEKARAIFPLRRSVAAAPGASLLPGLVMIMVGARDSSVESLLYGLTMGITSWMTAGFLGQWLEACLTGRRFHAGRTLAHLVYSFMLNGVVMVIFLIAITAGGKQWNLNLLATAAAALAASFLWFGYGLPWIMLRLTTDPPPEVLAAVHAAVTPGATAPPVRILRSDTVNGFAMIRPGWIGFTRGAVQHLTPPEITAIARHELAHLSEPPSVVLRRQLMMLSFTPFLFIHPLMATFGLFGGLLVVFFASTVFAKLLRGKNFQRHEESADAAAADDSGLYARTLERIYELNLVPVVIGTPGQAHPDLYDRVLAAGVTPSFPRPDPPLVGYIKLTHGLSFLSLLLAGLYLAVHLHYGVRTP